MKKKLKPIPEFKTEAEEREFWESKENDTKEFSNAIPALAYLPALHIIALLKMVTGVVFLLET